MKGSIRQRSKGSWQLRYDILDPESGMRKYVSETVRGTKKEAERVLRERVWPLLNPEATSLSRGRRWQSSCSAGWTPTSPPTPRSGRRKGIEATLRDTSFPS